MKKAANKAEKQHMAKKCTVENCEKKHYGKGFCTKHYQRYKTHGSTVLKQKPKICIVENCTGKVKGKGLCLKHYSRFIRNGVVTTSIIIKNDSDRLRANSKINENGCWLWRKHTKLGYGVTCVKGKSEQAHRASWKTFRGEIKDKLQVNHKCHNRLCINPEHLYLGSQKDNMRDMKIAGRENKARGSASGMSKLSEEEVLIIKNLLGKKICIKEIIK